jgi:uncharacterized delta-60 repeat protein
MATRFLSAAPGDLDTRFNPGSGIDGNVTTILRQPDGKIIIGGEFTSIKEFARPRVARINANGSADTTFTPPPIGRTDTHLPLVRSLALQPDGKIVISGTFILNGSATGVARLNTDGSVDPTFSTVRTPFPSELNGPFVSCMALQPDGKILVGGKSLDFGFGQKFVARLNNDGSVDTSFDASAVNGSVVAVVPAIEGGAYIVSTIDPFSGLQSTVVRLKSDGSVDASFKAQQLSYAKYLPPISSEGKLLVVLTSTSAPGPIVRLNADGTLDGTFVPEIDPKFVTYAFAVDHQEQILVAGYIPSAGPSTTPAEVVIYQLSQNGSLHGAITGLSKLEAIAPLDDGSLLIGGDFRSIRGVTREHIAKLGSDGGLDPGFDPGTGLPDRVSLAAVQTDGKIVVAYAFYAKDDGPSAARLNADGTIDSSYSVPLTWPSWITAMALQLDNKAIVTTWNGAIPLRLNLDGSIDPTFNPTFLGTNFSSIAVQTDGKVLIAGSTLPVYSRISDLIVRIYPDGTLDPSFKPPQGGVNSIARNLQIQPDGKILVTGQFGQTEYGSSRIFRLNQDGGIDKTFVSPTAGLSRPGFIAQAPGGKVVVAGSASDDFERKSFVKRLTSTGAYDQTFRDVTLLNVNVYSLAVQADGKVLIGGDLISSAGEASVFFRFNQDGTPDYTFRTDLGPVVSNSQAVTTVIVLSEGQAIIAGSFTTVNQAGRWYAAKIFLTDSPPRLDISSAGENIQVTWPANQAAFNLEFSKTLGPGGWTTSVLAPVLKDDHLSVSLPAVAGSAAYFRLAR